MLWTLASAVVIVGFPVFALSWFIFQRLFASGTLDISLSGKDFDKHVSKLGKSFKDGRGFEARWMKFGGGFYGIGAMWTLIIVELRDLVAFVSAFEGFGGLLEDGIVSLIVAFFINQLQNFITAITWFLYWGDGIGIAIYLAVAYGGYYAGVQLARSLTMDELKAWIEDMVEHRT